MNTIAEYLSNYHGAEIAGALSFVCFFMAWRLLYQGEAGTGVIQSRR